MGVSYNLFTGSFIGKVSEFDFIKLDDYTRDHLVDGYLKRASAQFNKICKYDLLNCDDEQRVINEDIPNDELEEILDIISEGMIVQWLKPYLYKADNLKNLLNTADFTQYSPAELLRRIRETYQGAQRDFSNMMKEYSYNHGDLGSLSL